MRSRGEENINGVFEMNKLKKKKEMKEEKKRREGKKKHTRGNKTETKENKRTRKDTELDYNRGRKE